MFIGFLPKLVRRSALMGPLSVPNFSPIRARIHVLWRILQNVRNEGEEKKKEIKNEILFARISETAGAIFFSNLACRLP